MTQDYEDGQAAFLTIKNPAKDEFADCPIEPDETQVTSNRRKEWFDGFHDTRLQNNFPNTEF